MRIRAAATIIGFTLALVINFPIPMITGLIDEACAAPPPVGTLGDRDLLTRKLQSTTAATQGNFAEAQAILLGDRQAQAELDRRNRVLNQMSGMLQGQIAAQNTMNSVRRQELSRQWQDAAHIDRAAAHYYAKKGDNNRARYHSDRAADFEKGAKRLRKDQ